MFNFHDKLSKYESEKVALSQGIRQDLYKKRDANRNRLKANIKSGVRVEDNHFVPQGSMAVQTTVQETGQDYDIDDGVWFYKEDLETAQNTEMTAYDVKAMVLDSLKGDGRFKKQPKIMDNCVRIFYSEGYHVDIPAYRKYESAGADVLEIAGENGWKASDPTEINRWFEERVQSLNAQNEGSGNQYRRIIRLMKRFARSRGDSWDMPNGLKLTMLVDECFTPVNLRDDETLFLTMDKLKRRLDTNLVVYNRAQKGQQDMLTKTARDPNMVVLQQCVSEALTQLAILNDAKCTQKAAKDAWEWVFKTDGYFDGGGESGGGDRGGSAVASGTPSAPFVKSETRYG